MRFFREAWWIILPLAGWALAFLVLAVKKIHKS